MNDMYPFIDKFTRTSVQHLWPGSIHLINILCNLYELIYFSTTGLDFC